MHGLCLQPKQLRRLATALLVPGRLSDVVVRSRWRGAATSRTSCRASSGTTDPAAVCCLLGVAAIWGSYAPIVRRVFSYAAAPSPAELTAEQSLIQAMAFGALLFFTKTGAAAEQKDCVAAPSVWFAGAELGLYTFCGVTLQALGLEVTTATRGAFLLSATSLLTPLMETVSGGRLTRRMWLGCMLALAGSALLILEGNASDGAANHAPSQIHALIGGHAYMLAAAAFYSWSTVRLGSLAPRFAALELGATKSIVFALLAVGWLTLAGAEGHDYWHKALASPAFFWISLLALSGTAAVTLETVGQRAVSPSVAQVLYATTPIWSAVIAAVVLDGEREAMGPSGWIGSAILLAAGLIANG